MNSNMTFENVELLSVDERGQLQNLSHGTLEAVLKNCDKVISIKHPESLTNSDAKDKKNELLFFQENLLLGTHECNWSESSDRILVINASRRSSKIIVVFSKEEEMLRFLKRMNFNRPRKWSPQPSEHIFAAYPILKQALAQNSAPSNALNEGTSNPLPGPVTPEIPQIQNPAVDRKVVAAPVIAPKPQIDHSLTKHAPTNLNGNPAAPMSNPPPPPPPHPAASLSTPPSVKKDPPVEAKQNLMASIIATGGAANAGLKKVEPKSTPKYNSVAEELAAKHAAKNSNLTENGAASEPQPPAPAPVSPTTPTTNRSLHAVADRHGRIISSGKAAEGEEPGPIEGKSKKHVLEAGLRAIKDGACPSGSDTD